jgi:hypothetical protein
MMKNIPFSAKIFLLLGATGPFLVLSGCRTWTAEPPRMAAEPAKPKLMSWRVASAHLEDIFAQIPNSSIDDFRKETPEAERIRVNASHGEAGIKEDNAHVYGEPTAVTSDLIFRRLGLGEQDVLYDFGCGRGFFLMQALLTTPIHKAVGVELATSRVDIAKLAHKMMLEQGLLAPDKVLELHEQDMTVAAMEDATVVYMDSVFFSDELLNTMARRMSRARNMRTVVMIQKGLPANPWFELEGKERLKMSWSPKFGTDVLFYRRTSAPAD